MAEFVFALKRDALSPGQMTSVDISGRDVLVARNDQNFFAADNRCPHLGGNLSKGKLTGNIVTCPLHQSQFDLASGNVIRWTSFSGVIQTVNEALRKPRPLRVYPVRLEGDDVMVKIE